MTRAQRRRHLLVWLALAALLPLGLLAALASRPPAAPPAPGAASP